MSAATFDRAAFKERIKSRDVYLWGAGQQGRGMQRLLEREGIPFAGFIDSSVGLQATNVQGAIVHSPGVLRDNPRAFVIASAFFYDDAIRAQCESYGLGFGKDFVSYKDLKPLDYAVEISGVCNLVCMSCPRSARFEQHPTKGFMSVEVFEEVLDKILKEDPFVGNIMLYQWGEPLLNKQLPEILEAAHKRGVSCAISSNLSLKKDLEPIIEARPGRFRISMSNWGKDYEITHTGGRWHLFKENLLELARLRDEHNPGMKTELYYHVYRHNQGEPLERVRALCKELNLDFFPVWAYIIGLDDVLGYLEGGQLSGPGRELEPMLEVSVDEGMSLAYEERDKECLVMRVVHINWNLNVSQCMMFFYPEGNTVAANFLNTPLSEIVTARTDHPLCDRCMPHGLHRYCSVYANKKVELPTQSKPAPTNSLQVLQ
jgi:MoaA/NifB/PqqE/SkfB family radical SAM enzyme